MILAVLFLTKCGGILVPRGRGDYSATVNVHSSGGEIVHLVLRYTGEFTVFCNLCTSLNT